MKFIKLESRGGNYLVVAENVAWLRTAENGQTSVGIIGSQPLLVVGSVEEVAAKILAASAPDDPAAVPQSAPEPVPANVAEEPAEEPIPAKTDAAAEPEARFEADPANPRAPSKGEAPPTLGRSATLSERIATAAANPKVKPGSQRMMGMDR